MQNNNYKNKPFPRGSKVFVGDMPINTALRKFKQQIDDSGLLEEIKARMFYEKPTTVKKRKAGAARARWKKKLRDQELPKKMY
jgi:small subunit ribosomal protein S21